MGDEAAYESAWEALQARPKWLPDEAKAHVDDRRRRLANKYLLVQQEHRVGPSALWKAWDVPRKCWVSVRVLVAEDGSDEHKRFQRESQIASQFECPGIPALREVGFDPQQGHFIVCERAEGTPLKEVPKPVEQKKAIAIISEIGRIVQHLHNRGIVHRDLTPGNIFLDRVGHIVFPHFATAKPVQGGTLTAANEKLGDPAFMAPEQLRGEKADPCTDTYQVGALLYYLLTGRPPFGPGKPMKIADDVLKLEAKPLHEWVKEIPGKLEAICFKAIAKSQSERYARPVDLVEDLKNFVDGKPTVAKPKKGFLGGLFGK